MTILGLITKAIVSDDITISSVSVENNMIVISVDDSEIFTLQGISLTEINDSELIREERLDNEQFVAAWNRAWNLSIDLFKASFPHEHYYAEAVQNEFLAICKWLNIVHRRKKVPFTVDSPLPRDLLIRVN